MKAQSFLASLFHSVIWRATSRGAGFIKHVIIAAAIGLSTQLDVFYMAMAFIGILISTWAGALEFAAIPGLVRAASRNDTRAFGEIGGGIFLIASCGSILITLFILLFHDMLAALAFGFDPSRREALGAAFIWLIPVMLLTCPAMVFVAVLRAKRFFAWQYQAGALSAVIILACIIIAPDHPAVLLWSASAGVITAFLYTGAVAIRYMRFNINPFSREIMSILKTVPALMILYGTYSIFVILDRSFASFLTVGSISAIAYAMVLAKAIPTAFGIRNAFMTVAAEKSGRVARAKTVNDLFSLTIFLSMGATAFIVLTGADIIAILFERGAFSAANTEAVAAALTAFAFMIVPSFVMAPLDQIYQLEKRIGFMVGRTLIGIAVGIVLNYMAVFVLEWGIFGIALATAISYWLICILGIIGLVRLGYPIAVVRHLKWLIWLAMCVLAATLLASAFPDLGGRIVNTIAVVIAIGAAMLIAGLLYRGHERDLLRDTIKRVLPEKISRILFRDSS